MDQYLPYLDSERLAQPGSEYEAAVDFLITRELQAINKDRGNSLSLHPTAQKILDNIITNSTTHRFSDELYQEYLSFDKTFSKKRRHSGTSTGTDDDQFLEHYKHKFPRIDLTRYSDDANSDSRQLAITASYLHHQLIILESLLPRALIKQWTVQNEFLERSDLLIQNEIERQEKQLSDLEAYRKQMQLQYRETFDDLQNEIYETLLDKLDTLVSI